MRKTKRFSKAKEQKKPPSPSQPRAPVKKAPTLEDELYSAVQSDQPDKIKSLIQRGANPSARSGIMSDTPLHQAIHASINRSHEAVIEILLAAEADIMIENKNGLTPVTLAWNDGNSEMATLLIQRRYPTQSEQLKAFEQIRLTLHAKK